VFTAPKGGPLREHHFGERQFKPAAVRAGLPATLRVHDLRHTAASLLIREGASIKALQKQLGHKDAMQTLNRYGHLYPTSSTRSPTASSRSTNEPARRRRRPRCGPTVPPWSSR
jgi:integrase